MTGGAAPPELSALRTRLAELYDLGSAMRVLIWDQSVSMPPAGTAARADAMATLERIAHERLVAGETERLLDALEPYRRDADPESDDARLLDRARRDFERAARVPGDLAADMAHAASMGEHAWLEARDAEDFAPFRDALARQIDLRRRYAACFPEAAHPYDVVLEDFEEGATVAGLEPLFTELQAGLAPLVEAAAGHDDSLLRGGHFPLDAQRALISGVLDGLGFDAERYRLDVSVHPFSQSPGLGDHRITTRYREDDLSWSLHSALHEWGHALYEAQIDPRLGRGPLLDAVSLGVHESQSRLWENQVGRGLPFCRWLVPQLRDHLDGFAGVEPADLFRALNGVERSLVRTEADETTYNLHLALRFGLEVAVLEGSLEIDDLPDAWDDGMQRLLGVTPPRPSLGVLQDVHWAIGLIGYFPTYTIGNVMSAQLWARLREDIPDLDARIESGDFAVLREWLRERVHRHGRRFPPAELLRRATGDELDVRPLLGYLGERLAASGAIPAAA